MKETLNVFGVRANYMAQFREYLQQEGIPTDYQEIQVPIHTQDAFLLHPVDQSLSLSLHFRASTPGEAAICDYRARVIRAIRASKARKVQR